MDLAAALLAPVMLLVAAIGGHAEQGDGQGAATSPPIVAPISQSVPEWPIGIVGSFEPESAWQVHIEQRMTIRIAPHAGMPILRDMFVSPPPRDIGPRFSERKIGNCLPIAAIAGVEPNGPNNLILFLRDRRMINARLERSCLARSFYSGFYLSHSSDGNICVDRDTLLSRSGTACKLSRIRQLVDVED